MGLGIQPNSLSICCILGRKLRFEKQLLQNLYNTKCLLQVDKSSSKLLCELGDKIVENVRKGSLNNGRYAYVMLMNYELCGTDWFL